MTNKYTITINLTINQNGESKNDTLARLIQIADYAAANGMFTGDGPAEVELWGGHVKCEITTSEFVEKPNDTN